MAVVAVSLKMYFDRARTLDYCREVAARVGPVVGPALGVEAVVLPDHLSLAAAAEALLPAGVVLGAQDLCAQDRGPYTGEVSGADLADLGVRVVEVGHAERRSLFGESDAVVAAKTTAAVRNRLVPLLCVGEPTPGPASEAADFCVAQLGSAVAELDPADTVWVAYEPVWAIGAPRPAPAEHVIEVCRALGRAVADRRDARVLYGGSAGPGLLTELWPAVDGVFLGGSPMRWTPWSRWCRKRPRSKPES
ncbi:triose-phosphate isomerase family protein [Propioniciclava sp.]|uniref:triose-phosphate isomerase family protein n=1 Tax=Propioniciclava sp. TaxID=2038686 RepID=UPI002D1F9D07|nr:triose-phosphate isomerase family protein [Propioniciclava sp.]